MKLMPSSRPRVRMSTLHPPPASLSRPILHLARSIQSLCIISRHFPCGGGALHILAPRHVFFTLDIPTFDDLHERSMKVTRPEEREAELGRKSPWRWEGVSVFLALSGLPTRSTPLRLVLNRVYTFASASYSLASLCFSDYA